MAVIQDAEQTTPSRHGRTLFGGGTDGNEQLTAIAGGAVLAIVLLPYFGAWTAAAGHFHHHHHG